MTRQRITTTDNEDGGDSMEYRCPECDGPVRQIEHVDAVSCLKCGKLTTAREAYRRDQNMPIRGMLIQLGFK